MGIGNPHGYPDYTWPMVWVLQDGELWPIEQWVAKQGVDKLWHVAASVAAGGTTNVDLYTVPANKALYLVASMISATVLNRTTVLYRVPDVEVSDNLNLARQPVPEHLTPPVVIPAGKTLRVTLYNQDVALGSFYGVVRAFEIDA